MLDQKRYKKDYLSVRLIKNLIIGRKLWEAATNDDTEKNGLMGEIGNRLNQFRNMVEPNLNSYYYELMRFYEPFSTSIVKDKTGFPLRYHEMNS